MCFTNKRKRNRIRKEDSVPDPVWPSGRVGSGTGARAVTSFNSFNSTGAIRYDVMDAGVAP